MFVVACGIVLAVTAMPRAMCAAAQPMPQPSIAVLDIQRILRDSKAAKSIRPQVEQLRHQYQDEVRRQESELRKAEQELVRQRAILAPEAFAKRRRQFEELARKAQRNVQANKRRLEIAYARAMSKVQNMMLSIAQEVANRRKINLVILKSAVLLSKKSLDITAETLGQLDKKLAKVKVTLPENK